jgi:hypothetical protein
MIKKKGQFFVMFVGRPYLHSDGKDFDYRLVEYERDNASVEKVR